MYSDEFPVNASVGILFSYLSTDTGLEQWFAPKVVVDGDIFTFIWEGYETKAKLVSIRSHKHVRFEILEEGSNGADPSYIEINLEVNELTKEVFMTVLDYSSEMDPQESSEYWNNLVKTLKERVGG